MRCALDFCYVGVMRKLTINEKINLRLSILFLLSCPKVSEQKLAVVVFVDEI